MVDTPAVLDVRDGNTPPIARNLGGTTDGSNTFYASHTLRADGAPVGAAAPLPVGDSVGNAALGTPADTAWTTGSGTLVGLLKGIYAKLAGVGLAAGSAVIGAVTQSGSWTVGVSNFPSGFGVSGTVAVSNLPATQPVSGSVNVGNFPATQPVSLAGTQAVSLASLPALVAGSAAVGTVGVTSLPALVAGSAAIGTVGVTALPALAAGTNAIGTVTLAGSTGHDYSANTPTLPVIGANFAASGPYASYVLLLTVPALSTRNEIEIQNVSGAQIAVLLDDGTAATSAAPVNASLFSLAAGSALGAQGGSWSSTAFKGRVQVYAASSAAFVEVSGR